MKKINLSAIMKRAWEIKKEDSRNIFGLCLKMAWAEAKGEEMGIEETVKANLEKMMYSDYHIHAGVEREVATRKNNGKTFFVIKCFSLAGNYKGQYKCGYIVDATGEYVCGVMMM